MALDVIDTPRTYRAELPPKALPWSTVERLLASIDHKSKSGWRDHCVLHLLANYGLRPSEVVALRLDSIDWAAGTLRVIQRKTGTELLLPLASPTLKLLQDYLEQIGFTTPRSIPNCSCARAVRSGRCAILHSTARDRAVAA